MPPKKQLTKAAILNTSGVADALAASAAADAEAQAEAQAVAGVGTWRPKRSMWPCLLINPDDANLDFGEWRIQHNKYAARREKHKVLQKAVIEAEAKVKGKSKAATAAKGKSKATPKSKVTAAAESKSSNGDDSSSSSTAAEVVVVTMNMPLVHAVMRLLKERSLLTDDVRGVTDILLGDIRDNAYSNDALLSALQSAVDSPLSPLDAVAVLMHAMLRSPPASSSSSSSASSSDKAAGFVRITSC